jgi:hypothetical protein
MLLCVIKPMVIQFVCVVKYACVFFVSRTFFIVLYFVARREGLLFFSLQPLSAVRGVSSGRLRAPGEHAWAPRPLQRGGRWLLISRSPIPVPSGMIKRSIPRSPNTIAVIGCFLRSRASIPGRRRWGGSRTHFGRSPHSLPLSRGADQS